MKTAFTRINIFCLCMWIVACASPPTRTSSSKTAVDPVAPKPIRTETLEGREVQPVTPPTEDEMSRLSRAAFADPTQRVLDDVEKMIDEDRPVQAAEFMEIGAIPAARTHLSNLKIVMVSSPGGKKLKQRLVTAYQHRLDALGLHQSALARGPVEDLQLVDAIRARRQAQQELVEVQELLEESP